jgi:two-component system heavy metal sensor histidine kinase CusS
MKFRSRLIGAVTGVTVVTLGLAFAAISHLVNSDQQRQLDRALLHEAREEASEAARGGDGTHLLISDGPGPYANDIGPLTKYGVIFAGDGRVLSLTETFHGHAPPFAKLPHAPDECFDLWFHREHLRAVLTAVPQHPGNLLMLAAPRLDLDSDKAFLHRAMLIVFAVAVGWAALVATWIVRRLTRGHAMVTEVARQVVGGDLSARIHPGTTDPEVTQLALDVNQMIDQLAQLLRSRDEFITHAAHELRSPLTTLLGELTLALRRSRDANEYRQAIEGALASAHQLRGLAENLLTLARIGSDVERPREVVWLNEAIDRARRTVAGEASRHAVTIDVDDEPRAVSGCAQDLERLFCNLLENAIRHSPRGGRVRVALGDDGAHVSVRVRDQGPGVDAGERDRIFEPFYRSPSAYGTPGYGLGLPIARKVARAHGGELALGHAAGGAEFVVQLPKR